MPVQSKNKSNNITNKFNNSWNKTATKLGINYTNWAHMSLMRLNFIAVVLVTISWIFLIIAIILLVISSDVYQASNAHNEINQAKYLSQHGYYGENGFGIFSIIVFFCLWVALFIMGYYMTTRARDIDVLTNNWWWSIFDICLPWIFVYVSYFVWKVSFDHANNLKGEDLNTNLHYEYEKELERESEVDYYREKKEDLIKKEEAQNSTKEIKISGKALTGNKKKRK